VEQAARGELEEALEMFVKKKPVEDLPVISKPKRSFRLAAEGEEEDAGNVPSMDELLSRIESDELLQLEEEDRAAMAGYAGDGGLSESSGMPSGSGEVLPSAAELMAQLDDLDDEDSSGLPVVSAVKRPEYGTAAAGFGPSKSFLPEEVNQAIIAVPSLDEILGRIDADEMAGAEGASTDQPDVVSSELLEEFSNRCEADIRLREAAQVHPDRHGSFDTYVGPFASSASSRMELVMEARERHEDSFKDVDPELGWDFYASDVTRRKPDPKGISDNVTKESASEDELEDNWPEPSSSALGDLLRSMQPKPTKQSKQTKALEKKPPSQRTEALPGVRMPGTKKPKAKPGPKSAPLKKGGVLDRRLRMANAGGSLDTLFEDKAEEEGEAPDVECILAGRPLRCSYTPQAFSCVVDCQRDDWKRFS